MMTHVLLVKTPLPAGHTYTNTQPYEFRGWCFAEMLMSSIVKDNDALIDLSKLTGDETTVYELREHGKANRSPPIAPDTFRTMLTSGVEDGRIKFTNKGDVGLVAGIYERAFLDEMAGATELFYIDFGWGDEEIKTLATALIYAHDKQVLGSLESLNLDGNQIGDAGVAALAALAKVGSLKELWLVGNPASREAKDALKAALPGCRVYF